MKRVAVVNGGTRGIGAAIVKKLLAEQAIVHCIYYKSNIKLDEESASYPNLFFHRCDVKKYEDVKETVKKILDQESKVDILINNAGCTKDRTLHFMSKKAWDEVIETNLNGVFHFTKLISNNMIANHSGVIINMSSITSSHVLNGQSNYSASKAGVEAFTKVVAKELCPFGVRVNSVSPGFIETEMTASLDKESIEKEIPLKRLGKPEEVAKLILFLVNDDSAYITGQNIIIDGGVSLC